MVAQLLCLVDLQPGPRLLVTSMSACHWVLTPFCQAEVHNCAVTASALYTSTYRWIVWVKAHTHLLPWQLQAPIYCMGQALTWDFAVLIVQSTILECKIDTVGHYSKGPLYSQECMVRQRGETQALVTIFETRHLLNEEVHLQEWKLLCVFLIVCLWLTISFSFMTFCTTLVLLLLSAFKGGLMTCHYLHLQSSGTVGGFV